MVNGGVRPMAGIDFLQRCRLFLQKVRNWNPTVKTDPVNANAAQADSGLPSTLTCVEMAHEEWLAAKKYFESVSEPDLVEHAVHVLLAAEKRYEFLLREAKNEGISGYTVLAQPDQRVGSRG